MKAFTANHANRYSRINRAWLGARGPRLSASWSPWYRYEYSASICCSDNIYESIGTIVFLISRVFFCFFYYFLNLPAKDLNHFCSIFFFFSVERKNDLYLNRDRDVFLDRNSDRVWYRDRHFLGYDRECRCSVTRVSSVSSVSSIDSTLVLLRFGSLLFGQGYHHEGEDD